MAIEGGVAGALISVGAVMLRPREPFTWASGIKSPVYVDNRLTLGDAEARTLIAEGFAALIRERFAGCEALFGTATAGIAHAAIAAHVMGLPMGYVRGSAKAHGREGLIEGRVRPGMRAVVIEDTISTAGSAIAASGALREAGAEVLGIAAIFTYRMARGLEALRGAGLRCERLTDIDALVSLSLARGAISEADAARILRFRDDPSDTKWMEGV